MRLNNGANEISEGNRRIILAEKAESYLSLGNTEESEKLIEILTLELDSLNKQKKSEEKGKLLYFPSTQY